MGVRSRRCRKHPSDGGNSTPCGRPTTGCPGQPHDKAESGPHINRPVAGVGCAPIDALACVKRVRRSVRIRRRAASHRRGGPYCVCVWSGTPSAGGRSRALRPYPSGVAAAGLGMKVQVPQCLTADRARIGADGGTFVGPTEVDLTPAQSTCRSALRSVPDCGQSVTTVRARTAPRSSERRRPR
jgi:hypothetical protein